MVRYIFISFIVFFVKSVCAQNSRNYFIKDSLDSYIRKSIRYWDVKNCGVVIVKGGSTVFKKGYDFKTFIKTKNKTSFPLASVSKHFTSLALLKILEKKNISIDSSIGVFLKDSLLSNNNFIENITFKNLLNHNLGYKNFEKDFFLFENSFTKKEILSKVYAEDKNIREGYGYHNVGYILAGDLIENISGMSYGDYLKRNYFEILNMTNTHTDYIKYLKKENKIRLYKGKNNVEIKNTNSTNFEAAGGVYSTLDDIGLWIKFLLEEKEVLSKHKLDTILIKKDKHPFNKISSLYYQLGLKTEKYSNEKVYFHHGGLPGVITALYLVPEKNIGFFIFCNKNETTLPLMLSLEILDSILNLPYRGYSYRFKHFYDSRSEYDSIKVKGNYSKLDSINSILGTYKNSIYGRLFVIKEGNDIVLLFEHHKDLKGKLFYNERNKNVFKTESLIFPKILLEKKDKKEVLISFFKSDPHKYKFIKE